MGTSTSTSGFLSSDYVEQVRQAGDIVRLIAEYVPLKQTGRRYKGLCPFHQEKSPSFSVDAERQLFYCFGCQTGGDSFKFLMLYEKFEFPEAVKHLAQRWGVALPAEDPQAARRAGARDRLRQMNGDAIQYFRALLHDADAGATARTYVTQRGISDDLSDALQIGVCADAWDGLIGYLRGKRYTAQEMVEGGLALERKTGSGHYDRFRNRLMFPIHDVNGRPIAFGGRTLGEDPAKYINSPETPAYTKGEHLYGLDLAKEAIRREGLAVVVEGYMDLAAVKQAGIDNVVASLGTAFTPQQARLLARFTQRIAFSYDGDGAGAKATQRSVDMLLERGFDVRVVQLPEGQDPDDCIRAEGADGYRKRLMEAVGYLDYLIRREAAQIVSGRIEEKVEVVNKVLPHLAKLSTAMERAAWVSKLADAVGIDEDLILHELRAAAKSAQPMIRTPVPSSAPALKEAEARMVALLLRSEEDRSRMFDRWNPEHLRGSSVEQIVRTIVQLIERDASIDYPIVLATLQEESDRELLTRIAFREDPEEGPTLDDCLSVFERQRLHHEEGQVLRALKGSAGGESPVSISTTPEDEDRHLLRMLELARQRDALM